MSRGKHKCPECGLPFTAEIVDNDGEDRLEITFDGTGGAGERTDETDAGAGGGRDVIDGHSGTTGGRVGNAAGTDAGAQDDAAGPATGKKLHPFPFDL